ncbi:MAG: xanthine dehydrogenase family protein subunit M [Proteobacteria bacterium]|nr:xanthine dehydrogenase family protein subunit M [Pseudomonadota bacterium]
MMTRFELYRPADIAGALDLVDKLGSDGWLIAGGQDSLDWFKDRAKRPTAVVDLSRIESMRGMRETEDGLEIGALVTVTEIEESTLIQNFYGVLADAASRVASPQIRNVGTIGGNVCQDTRCWYYRSGLDCYRAGGSTCYADTPEAMNREHCLFGADRCVAVSPSDLAPALVVLDASMVIQSKDGERIVSAEAFFIGPDVDIERMTVIGPGEILTTIRIPNTWSGATFYFEKVADRNTWDFALVNVAAAMRVENDVIQDIRIACGGVECVPRRMTVAEDIAKGSAKDEETAKLAGGSAARGAVPLNYNHFKITLLENLVMRAIRDS